MSDDRIAERKKRAVEIANSERAIRELGAQLDAARSEAVTLLTALDAEIFQMEHSMAWTGRIEVTPARLAAQRYLLADGGKIDNTPTEDVT